MTLEPLNYPVHYCSLRVRTYECDAYGHVNNAVYLQYLEVARGAYLEDNGLDYPALTASGQGIFVTEAHLHYRSPALPHEELKIATTPEHQGASWIVLRQIIHGPNERLVAEAQIKLVWIGTHGRPTRIPPQWRAKLLGANFDPTEA